jgi:hypothetical protein
MQKNMLLDVSFLQFPSFDFSSTGFYGKNGLDPITSISLYKTYVQPVLIV